MPPTNVPPLAGTEQELFASMLYMIPGNICCNCAQPIGNKHYLDDISLLNSYFFLECPQLSSSIPNGHANGTGSLYGALFVYSCLQGYSLIGQETLLCTEDGNWNASVPQCLKGICNSLSENEGFAFQKFHH